MYAACSCIVCAHVWLVRRGWRVSIQSSPTLMNYASKSYPNSFLPFPPPPPPHTPPPPPPPLLSCMVCEVCCRHIPVHTRCCGWRHSSQSHVSCLMSHVSCLISHVSCLMSHVSCLMSHVSCVMRCVAVCQVAHYSILSCACIHWFVEQEIVEQEMYDGL